MKKLIVLAGLVLLSFQFALGQASRSFSSISEKASALLDEYIEYDEMVGVSAAVWKDGEIIWQDAAGFSDLEAKKKANINMLNRTASIAKPMTAIAILQLYEQKKLNLDDPIDKFLPEFPKKKKGTITIRHLLNHTSGIGAYRSNEEAENTNEYPTLTDAMTVFMDRPLLHEPGTGYRYTTYGFVVLGAIIEKASGMNYRDYMYRNIWQKAGMNDTDVEVFGQAYKNKAKLYRKDGNREFSLDLKTNLSVKIPGGGFHTTAVDLMKFGEAILKNQFIKASTFEQMIENPGIKKQGNGYGMGWFLYADENARFGRVIGHSGSQSGTSTQLMINLDKQMVIAVLSNTSGAWNEVFGFTDKLDNVVLDTSAMKTPLRKPIALTNEKMDRFVGQYELSGNRIFEIYRKGSKLFSQIRGRRPIITYVESGERLYLRAVDIVMEFELDASGEQGKMFLLEGDERTEHNKLKTKKSLARKLYNDSEDYGFAAALKKFETNKSNEKYSINKDQMNLVANDFLSVGKTDEALAILELNMASFPGEEAVNENAINSTGYQLMRAGEVSKAIEFFKLNVKAFPNSWNAFDSLGEGYVNAGNKLLAIKNYEKSLALNPDHLAGIEALKKLRSKQ